MKTRILGAVVTLGILLGSTFANAQAAGQQVPPSKQSQTSAVRTEKTKAATPARGIPASWKQVPIPTLPAFKPGQPTRIELKNGMVIFLQEDHELPLIGGTMLIRGGYTAENTEKVGLVEMYGEVWRTGGTATKTGDELDDFLEARAAKVETDGSADLTSISFDCLKGDFQEVFNVWLDLLRNPAFREDKVALAQNQMNTGIARRNDNSGSIAGRESSFLAYGKNNPYVRVPEYYTVAAVSREDLVKWHKQYVHPNNIILGIVGDFDSKQVEATLRQAFENWERGPQAKAPQLQYTPAAPGIYVADKSDVNQSEIRMVELGIDRRNPDYFAVSVFNELFGGGFSSRLFSNLRTKQGLAYSVGGGIGTAFDHPGVTRLSMGTKTESTAEAIRGMYQQIDELKTNPMTEAELKRAKDSVLNSFIFNFDTPEKVLREKMTYEFYGYPLDFLDRYRAEVEKVTLPDLNRVAEKYLLKNKLAVLIVGNAAQMKQELASLGNVQQIDISIPESAPGAQGGSAAAAPAVSSNPEGKALMAKVVQALGGEAKVQAANTMQYQMTMSQTTPMGEMPMQVEATTVYPDRNAAKIATPQGELVVVSTPDTAFMSMGSQVRELPAGERNEQMAEMQRDLLFVAKNANNPSFAFSAAGTEKVDGKDLAVLDIQTGDQKLRWFIDPKDGRLVRATFRGMGPSGPAQMEETYSDWKTVDGLSLPMRGVRTSNGKTVQSYTINAFTVNPQVDPKLFVKPAGGAQ